MYKATLAVVCGFALAGSYAAAQSRPEYLDIMQVKVRPDKTKDYEDGIKKLADVNRKHQGDRWIALSTEYGDAGTLMFSSSRDNLAAIESSYTVFEKAMKEGLGPAGDKLMRDLTSWSASVHTEIRHRRWDLSVNAPSSAADLLKVVAESRWIRMYKADIKPGRNFDYIEAWKPFQAELAKLDPPVTVLVSESVTGTPALFVGVYLKSLAEADAQGAAVQKALASPAYANLTRVGTDALVMSSWEFLRIRPELSCAPDALVSMDTAFWKPKPMPAAAPKPRPEMASAEKK